MTLLDKIRLAIFGPDDTLTVEEAEADYRAAKERYDAAVERGDTRDLNRCLTALNVALNAMLRAHSDATRLHTHRASFPVRSRPARAA